MGSLVSYMHIFSQFLWEKDVLLLTLIPHFASSCTGCYLVAAFSVCTVFIREAFKCEHNKGMREIR